jgi:hypothetical protein
MTGGRPSRPPPGSPSSATRTPPGVTTGRRVEHFRGSDRAGWYNLVNLAAHDHGGHFIPWEIPDRWVEDLRRTFRGRR